MYSTGRQSTRIPVADDDSELKEESTGEGLSAARGHAVQKNPWTDLSNLLLCRAADELMPQDSHFGLAVAATRA